LKLGCSRLNPTLDLAAYKDSLRRVDSGTRSRADCEQTGIPISQACLIALRGSCLRCIDLRSVN
jgi:hypothetical protein